MCPRPWLQLLLPWGLLLACNPSPRLHTSQLDAAGATLLQDLMDHGMEVDIRDEDGQPHPDDWRLIDAHSAAQLSSSLRCPLVIADTADTADTQGTPLELLTLVEHTSLESIDGGVVGWPRGEGLGLLSLAAAAFEEGLSLQRINQPEVLPPDRTIALVQSGSWETARFWIDAQRVDAIPRGRGTGASDEHHPILRLSVQARYLVCRASDGAPPWSPLRGRRASLAPLSATLWPILVPETQTQTQRGPGAATVLFGSAGDGPGQFLEPDAIAVDARGRVLVGDELRRQVDVFDHEGNWLFAFGGRGSELGKFEGPVGGVAVGPSGDIYVVDVAGARVQVFSPEGEVKRAFGRRGFKDGQFFSPSGIAVGPSGRVFVSDDGRSNVQVFNEAGKHLMTIGGPGSGPGRFRGPESMAVSGSGELYVADEVNTRIQVFDGEGRYVRSIAESGPGAPSADIEGLAFDDRGRLWALDEDAGRIRAFLEDGTYLGSIGAGAGVEPGELLSPDGLAFHPAVKLLYVVDELNYRVQAFSTAELYPPEQRQDNAARTGGTFVLGRIGRPRQQVARFEPLAQLMARISGPGEDANGIVRAVGDITEMLRALGAREIDAVTDSSLVILEMAKAGVVSPLLAARRKGALTYSSVIFSRRDSGISDLEDLAGRLIAFEDPGSTSAFLLPAAMLRTRGLRVVSREADPTPLQPGEVGYVFAGAENTIAAWVFSGRVAAGAFSDLDWARFAKSIDELHIVERSEPILYYLLAVRGDMEPGRAERLRQALLSLDAEGQRALKTAQLDAFVSLDALEVQAPYARAQAMVERAGAR